MALKRDIVESTVSIVVKIEGWKKEGNVLFNNALNTFNLWLYGIRLTVKEHGEKNYSVATASWDTLSD